MDEQIHPTAAEGFDAAADVYERARPGYPASAVDFIVRTLGLRAGDAVVDVGAGTGKLTKDLDARGLRCIAIEPVEGMRDAFGRILPGVPVFEGTAEAVPLKDASADAVTVAQAFHWFRHAEALAEFHRVLRPGGGLALVWNARDDRVDWVARLTEIIDPYADGSEVGIPRHRDNSWRPALDDLPLFEPAGYAEFEHGHPTTPDGLLDRVASTSFIAVLPPDEKAAVLEQVHAMAAGHDLLDRFDFPYVCQVFLFRRV